MGTIEVVLGDITTEDVDAIVTAEIAVTAVRSRPVVGRIRLVAFDQENHDALTAAMTERRT